VTGLVDGFHFSENDLLTIDTVVGELYGRYDPSLGLVESSKTLHQKVSKLFSKSTEILGENRTCKQNNPIESNFFFFFFLSKMECCIYILKLVAHAFDLLIRTGASSYFDPTLARKLREDREAAEAAAEAERIADEEMQRSYELVDHSEIPHFTAISLEQINGLPGPQVAFINDSELLGAQPRVAYDGSPAVHVPIPHSLYQSLGAPTFAFAARTAHQTHAQPQQHHQQPQQHHQQPQQHAQPQQHQQQHQQPQQQVEQPAAQDAPPQVNGELFNERGGHRGGRGGSRRGGGNSPRNFQEGTPRNYDRAQEGNYHKSYERNHDKNYERPQQAFQQPKRGGAAGAGAPPAGGQASPRGRGASRGGARGGHQESAAH